MSSVPQPPPVPQPTPATTAPAAATHAGARTVLRPSTRSRVTIGFMAVPLLIPAVGLGVGAAFLPGLVPAAVLVALLELAAIAYVVLWIARTRFEFGDGLYLWQSEFKTSRFGPADAAKAVMVDQLDFGLQAAPHLFVLDGAGRAIARLNSVTFELPAMQAAVNDLAARGVAIEPIKARIPLRELDRLHPGALQWIEKHRAAYLLITLASALVVLVPVGILTLVLLLP